MEIPENKKNTDEKEEKAVFHTSTKLLNKIFPGKLRKEDWKYKKGWKKINWEKEELPFEFRVAKDGPVKELGKGDLVYLYDEQSKKKKGYVLEESWIAKKNNRKVFKFYPVEEKEKYEKERDYLVKSEKELQELFNNPEGEYLQFPYDEQFHQEMKKWRKEKTVEKTKIKNEIKLKKDKIKTITPKSLGTDEEKLGEEAPGKISGEEKIKAEEVKKETSDEKTEPVTEEKDLEVNVLDEGFAIETDDETKLERIKEKNRKIREKIKEAEKERDEKEVLRLEEELRELEAEERKIKTGKLDEEKIEDVKSKIDEKFEPEEKEEAEKPINAVNIARERYFEIKNNPPKKEGGKWYQFGLGGKYNKDLEKYKRVLALAEERYSATKKDRVQKHLEKGEKDQAMEFILSEVEVKKANNLEHLSLPKRIASGISNGIKKWEEFGNDEKDTKLVRGLKRSGKILASVAIIGGVSAGLVASGAALGVGSAAALTGGVGSYVGRRVLTSAVMAKALLVFPPKVRAWVSPAVIGTSYFTSGAASLIAGGVGYGASKLSTFATKKWLSEEAIKKSTEKKTGDFKKREINLDNLKQLEQEYEKIGKEASKKRMYRRLLAGTTALAGSIATLEVMGIHHEHQAQAVAEKAHEHHPITGTRHATENQNLIQLGEKQEIHTGADTFIHKGEGPTYPIMRQIESDQNLARELGWDGKEDLHHFASHTSATLAMKEGYIGPHGEEVRNSVLAIDRAEYVLGRDANGHITVLEKFDGREVETHSEGEGFETRTQQEKYEYGHEKTNVPQSHQPEKITSPEPVKNDLSDKIVPPPVIDKQSEGTHLSGTYQEEDVYHDKAGHHELAFLHRHEKNGYFDSHDQSETYQFREGHNTYGVKFFYDKDNHVINCSRDFAGQMEREDLTKDYFNQEVFKNLDPQTREDITRQVEGIALDHKCLEHLSPHSDEYQYLKERVLHDEKNLMSEYGKYGNLIKQEKLEGDYSHLTKQEIRQDQQNTIYEETKPTGDEAHLTPEQAAHVDKMYEENINVAFPSLEDKAEWLRIKDGSGLANSLLHMEIVKPQLEPLQIIIQYLHDQTGIEPVIKTATVPGDSLDEYIKKCLAYAEKNDIEIVPSLYH